MKKLAESGKLDSATCSDEELGELNLYAINTCLNVLNKEYVIRKEYNPVFALEKIPYLYLDTTTVPFEAQGEPKVRELIEKYTEGVFIAEKCLDLDGYPHCY